MPLSREVTINLRGKEGFLENTCCNLSLSPLPCALLPVSLRQAVAAGNKFQGILFLYRDSDQKGCLKLSSPGHRHKHG